MIQNKKLISWISEDKQIGDSFSFEKDGELFWSSVAIQKCDKRFKVYVDEILESEMVAENFLREEVIVFNNIECAFNFITKNTMASLKNLKPCKGQKIFNPSFF